jgi:intracellular multiplication protein IcmC
LFVKLIGLIAAVRGFLIFKKLGEGGGQAGVGVGLTHVLGGAMAVNIETTYNLLKNSVGF